MRVGNCRIADSARCLSQSLSETERRDKIGLALSTLNTHRALLQRVGVQPGDFLRHAGRVALPWSPQGRQIGCNQRTSTEEDKGRQRTAACHACG